MTDRVILRFCREDDFSSRLICLLSPLVSHVEFITPDGRALGARLAGGVQARPIDYASFALDIRCTIVTPAANALYAAAESHIGEPYDWKAIVGFADGAEDLHQNEHCICSAFAQARMTEAGLMHRSLFRPYQTTPHDVLRVAEQLGDLAVVKGSI